MQTAQLLNSGRSQSVRLPEEYQFRGENVYIKKVGEAVLLVPVDKEWETFLHGLNSFSEDFMAEGRCQGVKHSFAVYIERDEDTGGYVATVPALESCHTEADTLDELMNRVQDVIKLCLETNGEAPLYNTKFVGMQQVEVVL